MIINLTCNLNFQFSPLSHCASLHLVVINIPLYKPINELQTTGGPAFRDGTMRVNDRIRCINGVELRGMKLPELQSLLYRQVPLEM